MLNSLDDKKLELEYPVNWEYRIVGHKKTDIETIVTELLGKTKYTLKSSRASKGGKYVSMVLKVMVQDENHRLHIYEQLKISERIVMVL